MACRFNFGRQPPRVKGIKVSCGQPWNCNVKLGTNSMCKLKCTPLQVYPGEKTGDDVVVETDAVWASSAVVALRVMQFPAMSDRASRDERSMWSWCCACVMTASGEDECFS